MSTRSTIGIQELDGTVSYIYCHFDGYEEHHAPILKTFDEKKTRELLALGDISSLGAALTSDSTVAYCRDRKEAMYPARTVAAWHSIKPEEYNYLLILGKGWFVSSYRSFGPDSEWKPIADPLEQLAELGDLDGR